MDRPRTASHLLFSLLLTGLIWVANAGQERPISARSAAIQLAVHEEVIAGGLSNREDLCLSVKGRNPSGDVVGRLREEGILVHKPSWCAKGPRGVGIEVRSVALTHERRAQVEVRTGDYNLAEGEDFGKLLRQGTYVLERDATGTWRIVDYKKNCGPARD